MSELKERLRMARERTGYTQLEVCRRLDGLTNRSLSRYETGAAEPDMSTLRKLVTLYEVSTDWALGLTDDLRPAGSSRTPPAILNDPALSEKARNLSDGAKEKLREYVDMLKTLDEVKGGSATLDMKKRGS